MKSPYTDQLPLTTAMAESSPYEPFDDPAYDIAERLIILAHLTFNATIWSASSKRIKRYWEACLERVRGSADTTRLSQWWQSYIEEMGGVQLGDQYLHEKNLLMEPELLNPPVNQQDVLRILREESPYLIDRARIWNKERRANKTTQENDVDA